MYNFTNSVTHLKHHTIFQLGLVESGLNVEAEEVLLGGAIEKLLHWFSIR